MRVLVTGSHDGATRLRPKLEAAGWEVVEGGDLDTLRRQAQEGSFQDLDAALVLPGDLTNLEGEGSVDRLIEFYERGLLQRARALSVVSKAVKPRGGCRFVLVGGHMPPAGVPDDQSARAALMAVAGQAAAADGGPGCTAKVLGPSATDDDIVNALVPTGNTPVVIWDLSDEESAGMSLDEWRLAIMPSQSRRGDRR